MNRSKTFFISAALILAGAVRAQIHVPLVDIDLAYPSISAVTVQLGGTNRSGLPTPFVIDGLVSDSLAWFCMDPLQAMYYSGSGKPVGSKLNYASESPAAFDKWTPLAPGLSDARLQNLADLFRAFAPTTTNQTVGGALQLAVWEIVNEFDANSFSLTSGQMRVLSGNASMLAVAQGMLDSLDDIGVRNFGSTLSLDFLIDGTFQSGSSSVLVQDLVGYHTAVPESGSFALGAVGLLLPVIWLRIRRSGRGNCLSLRSGKA